MKKSVKVFTFVLLVAFFICNAAFSDVILPRLISNGMVLQRGEGTKIWGWADPNEKITVNFKGQTYNTSACPDGQWSITLSELKAGGPYEMQIEADNNITLKNIMIGDVWVCSGQANMELTMERAKYKYPDVIANSENPAIRQFLVPDKYNFKQPQDDLASGSWQEVDPGKILNFTAVGYFFAKELNEKYDVPIGLVNSALGGSPIEAWMSEDALKDFPEHLETANKFKNDELIKEITEKDQAASNAWYSELWKKDDGMQNKWYTPDCNTSDWKTTEVPGYWQSGDLDGFIGSVWFRKEIDVPASMTRRPAKLWLGRIVDADETYINGRKIGNTTYEWPPRIYEIPPTLLEEGKSTIAVRVINGSGPAGFVPDKPYELTTNDQKIDLEGQWKYKIGTTMDAPAPSQTFIRWKPVGLYNAMIAPLLNYKIKGVIWYQGESNTGRAKEYQKLFPTMIADWRQKWGQGDFPFLYIQLANFMEAKAQPTESGWAELQEAQLKTLTVDNTAMIVTIDIGVWNDIHPLNKEDVGKRLALAARNLAYGEKNLVYSGPIYESMEIKANKIVLSFEHVDGGLVAKGGELKHFAIAGADKNFVWANAKIKDDKVIVWNNEIKNPVAVRYAWADNPEGANLYNKKGLPASPFRTDD
jgi:sialate O-acetylesterase